MFFKTRKKELLLLRMSMYTTPLLLIMFWSFLNKNLNHIGFIILCNKKVNDNCYNQLRELSRGYTLLCDETSNMYNSILNNIEVEAPEFFLIKKDSIFLMPYSDALNFLKKNKTDRIIISSKNIDLFKWEKNMFITYEYLYLTDFTPLRNTVNELLTHFKHNNSWLLRFLMKNLNLNIKINKTARLTTWSYVNNNLSFIPAVTFGDIKDLYVENLLSNLKMFIKKCFNSLNGKSKTFSMEYFIDGVVNIFIKTGLLKISHEEVEILLKKDYTFIYSLFPPLRQINGRFPSDLKYVYSMSVSLGFDFSGLVLNSNIAEKYFNIEKMNRLLKYTDMFLMSNFID